MTGPGGPTSPLAPGEPAGPAGPAGPGAPAIPLGPRAPRGSCPDLKSCFSNAPLITWRLPTLFGGSSFAVAAYAVPPIANSSATYADHLRRADAVGRQQLRR